MEFLTLPFWLHFYVPVFHGSQLRISFDGEDGTRRVLITVSELIDSRLEIVFEGKISETHRRVFLVTDVPQRPLEGQLFVELYNLLQMDLKQVIEPNKTYLKHLGAIAFEDSAMSSRAKFELSVRTQISDASRILILWLQTMNHVYRDHFGDFD